MNKSQVYKMLEIDSPADLEYFEQVADLLESEEEISEDIFEDVLSEISEEDIGEILENYFEEISANIPDDETSFFGLIDSLQHSLLLLCEDLSSKENRNRLASELFRFKEWYHDPCGAAADGRECSLMDAITQIREEKLGGESRSFDFTPSLGYEIDELSMNIGSYSKIDILGDEEEPEA